MINRDRIVTTFLELTAIDSPSGDEDAIAAELERRLRALGLDALQDSGGNVLAFRPGVGEPLLLSAHMDTVEPGRGSHPPGTAQTSSAVTARPSSGPTTRPVAPSSSKSFNPRSKTAPPPGRSKSRSAAAKRSASSVRRTWTIRG